MSTPYSQALRRAWKLYQASFVALPGPFVLIHALIGIPWLYFLVPLVAVLAIATPIQLILSYKLLRLVATQAREHIHSRDLLPNLSGASFLILILASYFLSSIVPENYRDVVDLLRSLMCLGLLATIMREETRTHDLQRRFLPQYTWLFRFVHWAFNGIFSLIGWVVMVYVYILVQTRNP